MVTTNISELIEAGYLDDRGEGGYLQDEIIFAAASQALAEKPDLTGDALYSLLWNEADTALAIRITELWDSTAEWKQLMADARIAV